MTNQPNPARVAAAIVRAQLKRRPGPSGDGTFDHAALQPILGDLRRNGLDALPNHRARLASYRDRLEMLDPDAFTRAGALAFWLNLYNAGALDLAASAHAAGKQTVLRVPGAFAATWANVAGERLSLNDIEHGKIRRFGDPRIHGALVCGSASCPTLRYEPFDGTRVDTQLDDQMRTFLAGGGAEVDRERGVVRLSRVFRWYGGDFTRPGRMPTWVPARKTTLRAAVAEWLSDEDGRWVAETGPRLEFAPYDWGLACSIA
jgi:hypothetical protein